MNISEEQLVDYCKAHNEPCWMTELRKKALKLTETLEMPKPDKTKLRKWDFDSFKQHDEKVMFINLYHNYLSRGEREINIIILKT